MFLRSLRALTVSVVFSIFPFVAFAADDASITAVSVLPSSTESNATSTMQFGFTTTGYTGTTLMVFFNGDSGPTGSGFDFSHVSFDAEGSGYAATVSVLENSSNAVAVITVAANTFQMPGDYLLILDSVANGSDGTVQPAMTTSSTLDKNTNFTEGASITIGDAGDDTDPELTPSDTLGSVVLSPDTGNISESVNYTFTVTTTAALSASKAFNFFFNSEGGALGFDFSQATMTGNDFSATYPEPGTSVSTTIGTVTLTEALAAGTYTFTLNGVVNYATAGEYTLIMTTDQPSPSAGYVSANTLTLVDPNAVEEDTAVPGVPKYKKFKVKKLKARSATLTWKAVTNADDYTLRLDKKTGKKFKKVKVFKNITALKKSLNKKFLQSQTTYRFKVKACNDVGCSKFSKVKKFTTK